MKRLNHQELIDVLLERSQVDYYSNKERKQRTLAARQRGENEDVFRNFVEECVEYVVTHGACKELFEIATENIPMKIDSAKQKVVTFRASYILEHVYFTYYEYFKPFKSDFIKSFPRTTNHSAHRHFSKIMLDILTHDSLPQADNDAITEACARWIVEVNAKVGMQVWAVEILLLLENRVDWLPDAMPDFFEFLEQNPSPAIMSRMKRWKIRRKS